MTGAKPLGTKPLDGRRGVPHMARWRPEPGGAVCAEAGALRLVVHPRPPGGYARFLVLRRPDGAAGCALLASGSEDDVPAAMQAAERAAARMALS